MNKHIPIYLYGTIIVFVGIFLLFSEQISFNAIKLISGISLTIGAVFAFISAFSQQRKPVQFAYHEMHAFAMIVYGVAVLMFCETPNMLISFTTFLAFFYCFSEIIFCNWLFNLGTKVVYQIVIVRLLLGLGVGIGAAVAMNFSEFALESFGILFIAVGVNTILYVPVMKETQMIDISKNLAK